MGHINERARESQQREQLREVARMGFAEDRRREREFSRTIGKRTLDLLTRIGQEEKTSSVSSAHDTLPAFVTRTSGWLYAKSPAHDATLGVRLEVHHEFQFIPVSLKSPRIYRITGEMALEQQESLRTLGLELHDKQYANAFPAETVGKQGGRATRGAIPEYVQRVARFTRFLDMTEMILDGNIPGEADAADRVFEVQQSLVAPQKNSPRAIEGKR